MIRRVGNYGPAASRAEQTYPNILLYAVTYNILQTHRSDPTPLSLKRAVSDGQWNSPKADYVIRTRHAASVKRLGRAKDIHVTPSVGSRQRFSGPFS